VTHTYIHKERERGGEGGRERRTIGQRDIAIAGHIVEDHLMSFNVFNVALTFGAHSLQGPGNIVIKGRVSWRKFSPL